MPKLNKKEGLEPSVPLLNPQDSAQDGHSDYAARLACVSDYEFSQITLDDTPSFDGATLSADFDQRGNGNSSKQNIGFCKGVSEDNGLTLSPSIISQSSTSTAQTHLFPQPGQTENSLQPGIASHANSQQTEAQIDSSDLKDISPVVHLQFLKDNMASLQSHDIMTILYNLLVDMQKETLEKDMLPEDIFSKQTVRENDSMHGSDMSGEGAMLGSNQVISQGKTQQMPSISDVRDVLRKVLRQSRHSPPPSSERYPAGFLINLLQVAAKTCPFVTSSDGSVIEDPLLDDRFLSEFSQINPKLWNQFIKSGEAEGKSPMMMALQSKNCDLILKLMEVVDEGGLFQSDNEREEIEKLLASEKEYRGPFLKAVFASENREIFKDFKWSKIVKDDSEYIFGMTYALGRIGERLPEKLIEMRKLASFFGFDPTKHARLLAEALYKMLCNDTVRSASLLHLKEDGDWRKDWSEKALTSLSKAFKKFRLDFLKSFEGKCESAELTNQKGLGKEELDRIIREAKTGRLLSPHINNEEALSKALFENATSWPKEVSGDAESEGDPLEHLILKQLEELASKENENGQKSSADDDTSQDTPLNAPLLGVVHPPKTEPAPTTHLPSFYFSKVLQAVVAVQDPKFYQTPGAKLQLRWLEEWEKMIAPFHKEKSDVYSAYLLYFSLDQLGKYLKDPNDSKVSSEEAWFAAFKDFANEKGKTFISTHKDNISEQLEGQCKLVMERHLENNALPESPLHDEVVVDLTHAILKNPLFLTKACNKHWKLFSRGPSEVKAFLDSKNALGQTPIEAAIQSNRAKVAISLMKRNESEYSDENIQRIKCNLMAAGDKTRQKILEYLLREAFASFQTNTTSFENKWGKWEPVFNSIPRRNWLPALYPWFSNDFSSNADDFLSKTDRLRTALKCIKIDERRLVFLEGISKGLLLSGSTEISEDFLQKARGGSKISEILTAWGKSWREEWIEKKTTGSSSLTVLLRLLFMVVVNAEKRDRKIENDGVSLAELRILFAAAGEANLLEVELRKNSRQGEQTIPQNAHEPAVAPLQMDAKKEETLNNAGILIAQTSAPQETENPDEDTASDVPGVPPATESEEEIHTDQKTLAQEAENQDGDTTSDVRGLPPATESEEEIHTDPKTSATAASTNDIETIAVSSQNAGEAERKLVTGANAEKRSGNAFLRFFSRIGGWFSRLFSYFFGKKTASKSE